MNARKLHKKKSDAGINELEAPLKFLSPLQKQKASQLSKDWKVFTYSIFGEIFDKV